MARDAQVERCLELIRQVGDGFAGEVAGLSEAEWSGPTNCPPWRVCDLASHVVLSGRGFVDNVRRGLAGSAEPPAAAHGTDDLASSGPVGVADALRANTTEFIGLYDGLGDEDLAKICFHRRGNRSVRWYAAHRLAELAFHRWDLLVSLGRDAVLDEQVALLLLPTLLESNVPRTYAAGLSQERGRGERFALAVADDASACWLIRIGPEVLATEPGDGDAGLRITGSAATLALLAYGRRDLPALVAGGDVRVEGDPALVDRFGLIFPRP